MNNSVKSVLLTTVNDDNMAQSVIFQIAVRFSRKGYRVLYISTNPIAALPSALNNITPSFPDISLVTFLYAKDKDELIPYLSGIHRSHRPPDIIMMQNMEKYVSGCMYDACALSALLSNAANLCSNRLPPHLFVSYRCPVPPVLANCFFRDIWCIHKSENIVKLQTSNQLYHFTEHNELGEPGLTLQRVLHKELPS